MRNSSEARQAAIKTAIDLAEKRFGKGAVMRLGDSAINDPVNVIPTGTITLDIATGIGGIPRGRVTEIYGPEASGKTTLVLHVIAEAQRMDDGEVAIIDVEHALDPEYARACGVDTDNLYIAQPDTGEQALEIADGLISSGAFSVVAIDSIAALVPRAEIEGDMGDSHMGLRARLIGQGLRKLVPSASNTNTALVLVNQLRVNLTVMFGDPEQTTGGRAIPYAASLRLNVRRKDPIKQGSTQIGSRTRVQVKKNKLSSPFKEAEFDIIWGQGICRHGCLLDAAVDRNVIQRNGAYYTYGDEKLGQGRENARDFLKQHTAISDEIEQRVRDSIRRVSVIGPSDDDQRDEQ